MQTTKPFDHRRHFEGLRKANYWPGWFFLPHGAEEDPRVVLSQKAWGIVYYDRQLVQNEKENQSC